MAKVEVPNPIDISEKAAVSNQGLLLTQESNDKIKDAVSNAISASSVNQDDAPQPVDVRNKSLIDAQSRSENVKAFIDEQEKGFIDHTIGNVKSFALGAWSSQTLNYAIDAAKDYAYSEKYGETEYVMDDETFNELTKDMPEQYHHQLEKAESAEHAQIIKDRIMGHHESMVEGMKNSKSFIAGSFVGAGLDPISWIGGAVVGSGLKVGQTAIQLRAASRATDAVEQYMFLNRQGLTSVAGFEYKGLTAEAMAIAKTDPAKAVSLVLQGRGYSKLNADMIASGNPGVGLGASRGAITAWGSVVPQEMIQAEYDPITYDSRADRFMLSYALAGGAGAAFGRFAESANIKNAFNALADTAIVKSISRGLDNIADGKVVGAIKDTVRPVADLMADISSKAKSIAKNKRKVIRHELATGKSLDEISSKDIVNALPGSGYLKVRVYDDAGVDTGKAKIKSVKKIASEINSSERALTKALAQVEADVAKLTSDDSIRLIIDQRASSGKITSAEAARLKSTPVEIEAIRKAVAPTIRERVVAKAGISALKKKLDYSKAIGAFAFVSATKEGLKRSYNPRELMATGNLSRADITRVPKEVESAKAAIIRETRDVDNLMTELRKAGYGAVNKSDIEFKAFYDETWGKLPNLPQNKIPSYKKMLDDVRSRTESNADAVDGTFATSGKDIKIKDANADAGLKDSVARAMFSDQENSPPVRVAFSWFNSWFNSVASIDRLTRVRSAIQAMRGLAGDTQGSTDTMAKAGAFREKFVISTRFKAQINIAFNRAVKEYRKLYPDQAKSMTYNGSEFSHRTFLYLDGSMPIPDNMPHMKAYVNTWHKASDDLYAMLHNPGILDGTRMRSVAGAEDPAARIKNYVPHVQSIDKYSAIVRRHGVAAPEEFFKGYFKARHPNLTEGELSAISSGYLQHMRKGNVVDAENGSMMLNQNNINEFIDSYIRPLGTMSDEQLSSLSNKMQRNLASDSKAFGNLHSRVNIDMTYRATVRDINGNDVELKMLDFFNTDPLAIMERYIDKASGAIALGRFTLDAMVNGKMERVINGITKESEFNKMIASLDDVARLTGVSERSRNTMIHEFKNTYNGISGKIDPANTGIIHDYVGYMGKVATIIFAPMFIAAASSEIIKGMTIAGMDALRHPIKTLSGALRKRDSYADDLAQEMYDVIGIGNSNLMMHMDMATIGKYGEHLGTGGKGSFETKLSRALTKGANAVYKYSGTTGVTDVFSNYMAVSLTRTMIKDIVKSVENGKKSSNIHGVRGKEYGFNEDVINRIYKEFKAHGEYANGNVFSMKKLGIENWDAKTRHDMTMILDNVTRRAILQGDEGTRRAWMNSPFAKMLLQFKSFAMYSLSKDFLFNLHTRDLRGAMVIAGSMGSGMMSYMALSYLNSIGREDQDEYLADRFSDKNLYSAMVARSGAGLLTTIFDTGMIFGGQDPMFIHARSAAMGGNPSSHITSQFPVLGVLDNSARFIGGVTSDLFDYGTLSRETYKAGAALIPKFFGITAALRGFERNMSSRDDLE